MSDLERGHQDIVSSIQCLEYDLDFENNSSLESAREMILRAFCNINEPIRVRYNGTSDSFFTFESSRLYSAIRYVKIVDSEEMSD